MSHFPKSCFLWHTNPLAALMSNRCFATFLCSSVLLVFEIKTITFIVGCHCMKATELCAWSCALNPISGVKTSFWTVADYTLQTNALMSSGTISSKKIMVFLFISYCSSSVCFSCYLYCTVFCAALSYLLPTRLILWLVEYVWWHWSSKAIFKKERYW